MAKIQQTISPIDGSVYVERELATPQMIEQTLQQAVEAQRQWKQTSLQERAKVCTQMVDFLVGKAHLYAEQLTWQMGRPIKYTPFEITGGFQERAKHMISLAESSLQDIQVEPQKGFQRFIRREPLGTVLVLAPWNYPYLTAVNSIIPAIMSGNSVILKHSDQTPLVSEHFSEAFDAVGLPKGVFQHIHMTHDDVAEVIDDKRVNFVAFTGSVTGGHAVQQVAVKRFVGTGMELGGKDPAYVRSDVDLEHAIANVVDGAMFNSGQSCCAIERVYVHRDVYDDFVDGVVELVKQYRVGNPLDTDITLGPLVRSRSAQYVRSQVQQAVDMGAKALIDPNLFGEQNIESPYLAPQILVDVTHDMDVMTYETFGPVMGIMAVDNDAEAIHLMNDSLFGLTASVWTTDLDTALAIGNQLETGTVFMNRCDYLDPALAWTGVKDSGRGCTLSALGYDVLTRPKSFHMRVDI
jgi:acyl-CoA reductase-like NAD-dependent aldehyde dehydrogenase